MKIAIVRGTFLTQYECQTFYPLIKKHNFVAFSSLKPYHDQFPFPVIKLPSPMDITFGPFQRLKMPILNRCFIDAHWLVGLENHLAGFDIAHCADSFYHFTHQCILAKKQGKVKRVVATALENIPFNNEGIWGRKEFKRYALENIDHFIAISERTKTALMLEGCPESKITIIKQHIDINRFSPKKSRNFNSKDLAILFMGRLEWYKGIYEFLYCAKSLITDPHLTDYHLNFTVVGTGSELRRLIVLSEKLGIKNRVKFKNVPYDKTVEEYQKADIFVAPSLPTRTWQEQFCTVDVEAQACGLPIVSTLTGGIPENIEEAGILVGPGDIYGLTLAVKKLILNPKMRQALAVKARKHAEEEYDSHDGARKIDAVYQKVLQMN